VDLLVGRDPLEVDVLHLGLPRMHVDRAQQDLLLRPSSASVRWTRGIFVPQLVEQAF